MAAVVEQASDFLYHTGNVVYAFQADLIAKALNALTPPKDIAGTKPLDARADMILDPKSPHAIVYGRARRGGNVVAILTSGDRNQFKHVVCVHAGHECAAIEEVWIAGKPLGTLDANGFPTSGEYTKQEDRSTKVEFNGTGTTLPDTPKTARVFKRSFTPRGGTQWSEVSPSSYSLAGAVLSGLPSAYYRVVYVYAATIYAFVRVKKMLGATSQAAEPTTVSEVPAKWDSTKTLSGLCYTITRLDLDFQPFQGGMPKIEVLIKGKPIRDVRAVNYPNDNPAWSNNPALVIADYLTSEICGVPAASLITSGTAQAAAGKTFTLAAGANETQDYYFGKLLRINSGSGAYQDRTITSSRKNMLAYSQAFDQGYHVKSFAGVTANSDIAPDGSLTADTLTDNNSTSYAFIEASAGTTVIGQDYCLSVYIKKDAIGRATRYPVIRLSFVATTRFAQISVDTQTGETKIYQTAETYLNSYYTVDSGEYWRVVVSARFTGATAGSLDYRIYPAAGSGSTWVESVALTGSIVAWGVQLETGTTPTEYVRTEASAAVGVTLDTPLSHNLVKYSEELDNNYWTAVQYAATTTANQDGDAELVTSTQTGANQAFPSVLTFSAMSGYMTFTLEVKRGNGTYIGAAVWNGTAVTRPYMHLGTLGTGNTYEGSASTLFTVISNTTELLPDGYIRWSFTIYNSTGISFQYRYMQFYTDSAYMIGVTNGMYHYFRKVQLTQSNGKLPYIKTTSAVINPPDSTSQYSILGEGDLPLDDFITAANVCDEQVLIGGVLGPRYTVDGVVFTDEDQRGVLAKLAKQMAGTLCGTTWGIRAGAYTAPIMALSDTDIVGGMSYTSGASEGDIFNGVTGRAILPANGYAASDFSPYQNTNLVTADGQELWVNMDFDFQIDQHRIHNLCRIYTEERRNAFTIKADFSLKAWPLAVGDRVSFTSALLGQTNKVYKVMEKGASPSSPVSLVLKEDDWAIYDMADAPTTDETPNTSLPSPFTVPIPTNLDIVESLYETSGSSGVKVKATVTWSAANDGNIQDYELAWKPSYEAEYSSVLSINTTAEASDIKDGIYEFKVRARNHLGLFSNWSGVVAKEIFGLTTAPAAVSNLTVSSMSGLARCTWDSTTDLDVKIGGWVEIRYSTLSTGATWENAITLPDGRVTGDSTQVFLPLATGTYFAKFIDSSLNFSTTAASFVATEALVTGWTTVATSTQAPAFAGSKTGLVAVSEVLKLDGTATVDAQTSLIDTWGIIDSLGGVVTSGEYLFDATMDCGSIASRRFHATISAIAYSTDAYIDGQVELIDTWGLIDGEAIDDVSVELFISISDDNVQYSGWVPFMVGDFRCRYAKFKLVILSGSTTHNVDVSTLTVVAKI